MMRLSDRAADRSVVACTLLSSKQPLQFIQRLYHGLVGCCCLILDCDAIALEHVLLLTTNPSHTHLAVNKMPAWCRIFTAVIRPACSLYSCRPGPTGLLLSSAPLGTLLAPVPGLDTCPCAPGAPAAAAAALLPACPAAAPVWPCAAPPAACTCIRGVMAESVVLVARSLGDSPLLAAPTCTDRCWYAPGRSLLDGEETLGLAGVS